MPDQCCTCAFSAAQSHAISATLPWNCGQCLNNRDCLRVATTFLISPLCRELWQAPEIHKGRTAQTATLGTKRGFSLNGRTCTVWAAVKASFVDCSGAVNQHCHGEAMRVPLLSTGSVFGAVQNTVANLYAASPELLFGLSMLAAMPVLAVVGLFLLPTDRSTRKSLTRSRVVDRRSIDVGWIRRDDAAFARRRIDAGGLSIGSADQADVRIAGPGVAPYHARIAHVDEGFVLVSLAGSNDVAIYVNGKPKPSATLLGGETIEIGGVVLTFEVSCPGLDQLPVQAKGLAGRATTAKRFKGERRWPGGETVDHRARFSGH